MRVLGLDPGLRVAGYAVLEGDADRPELVEAGVIRLVSGSETPPMGDRLVELERDTAGLVERFGPGVVAMEALFAHGRFPQSALAMAHARGVMMLACRRAGLEVVELAPRLIKNAMTGSGRASKEQMQLAVARVLGLAEPPKPPDVADAIAIGIAGLNRFWGRGLGSGLGEWTGLGG